MLFDDNNNSDTRQFITILARLNFKQHVFINVRGATKRTLEKHWKGKEGKKKQEEKKLLQINFEIYKNTLYCYNNKIKLDIHISHKWLTVTSPIDPPLNVWSFL